MNNLIIVDTREKGNKKILGERVKIIKNEGLEKYDKLIGNVGVVTSFEFVNVKKPLIITFFKGDGNPQQYCFGFDEIQELKENNK